MISVLQAHVPHLRLNTLSNKLFADEWGEGCLVTDFWTALGATGLEVSPWSKSTDSNKEELSTRTLKMTLPVQAGPMCNSTRMTIVFRLAHCSDHEGHGSSAVVIETSAISHDVPYGDHFTVQERIVLLNQAGGVTVSKAFSADFAKRTIFQSTIQNSMKDAQRQHAELLLSILQRYVCGQGDQESDVATSSGSDDEVALEFTSEGASLAETEIINIRRFSESHGKKEKTRQQCQSSDDEALEPLPDVRSVTSVIVEVWELQRRTTPFHDDWRAPFLPHEHKKSARWVDAHYRKHPWIMESRHVSASADRPPIEAPVGMCLTSAGWRVIEPPGLSDEDWWQYAGDFYKKRSAWGDVPTFAICRRRLWRGEFVRSSLKDVPSPRIRVVKVWELQRRTTVFQSDWRAPFLPHDGKRRQRWVDLDFDVNHPWMFGSVEALAASNQPPIQAPAGWQIEGWVVAVPPGECDAGRWQYCSDFHKSPESWCALSHGLHCRRRLWSCIFTESVK
jgi:hypothetical protein